MFLRHNFVELNNHSILLELWYLSDHASLVVDIHISEEFVQDEKHIFIKNSKKKIEVYFWICWKLWYFSLMNKEVLEFIVQEFARISDCIWLKFSKLGDFQVCS